MQIPTKTLLIMIYPLLLLTWLVNLMLRRDRLRLHEVPSGESCWIERRAQTTIPSYFSEKSRSEDGAEPGAARLLTRLLRGIARIYTPPRQVAGTGYKAPADQERGIPNEVYTLW